MRTITALITASIAASTAFACAWIRTSNLRSFVYTFLGYGTLITILSLLFGLPIAYLLEKYRLARWWTYGAVAAAVGAALGGVVTGPPDEGQIQNPLHLTFSPWTRSTPEFAGTSPPYSFSDFVGSVAFGAVVGAVLGVTFWRLRERGRRALTRVGADRDG